MTQDLLEILRAHFGTVSSVTELSGVVAVRNKTAFGQLIRLVGARATCNKLSADLTRYPALVRVTEVPEV